MIHFRGVLRALTILAAALSLALAAGCTISQTTDPDARAGLGCIDDTPECISRRQATLRHLVDDQDRAWIKEPPSGEAYASGVRLFAFRATKKELTCDELAHGHREAEGARGALRDSGANLSAAQVARGAMLAGEVASELKAEISRRCKKG